MNPYYGHKKSLSKHGYPSKDDSTDTNTILNLPKANKSYNRRQCSARVKETCTLLMNRLEDPCFDPLRLPDATEDTNANKRRKTACKHDINLTTVCQRINKFGYLSALKIFEDLGQIIHNNQSHASSFAQYDAAEQLKRLLEELNNSKQYLKDVNVCCTVPRYSPSRAAPCHSAGCQFLILPGSSTHVYRVSENEYYYVCVNCMKKADKHINLMLRKSQNAEEYVSLMVKKSDILKEDFPNEPVPEPTVECTFCLQSHHRICVKYGEEIWSTRYSPHVKENFDENFSPGYVCHSCMLAIDPSYIGNSCNNISAKAIRNTNLAEFMTQELYNTHFNFSIKRNIKLPNPVIVREVYSRDKIFDAKPKMAQVFAEQGKPLKYPYTQRSIMVYQEKGPNEEAAVFNLIVDEYKETKTVHIAYLDSVRLYEPAEIRSSVYRSIILAYIKYLAKRRPRVFKRLAIWVCPPDVGDEYIFYGRPTEQIRLDVPHLSQWYRDLGETGKAQGLFTDYKELTKNPFGPFYNVPYMADDYFPDVLEKQLTSLEEEKERYRADLNRGPDFSQPSRGTRKTKASKARKEVPKPPQFQKVFEDLFGPAMNIMYMTLKDDDSLMGQEYVEPTDVTSVCGSFMSNRDNFLTSARRNRLDFMDNRRAVYSTMFMHEQMWKDSVNAACSYCDVHVSKGKYCVHCQLDYCERCSNTDKHSESEMRDFVLPYDVRTEIKTSNIFKSILQIINEEGHFLASLAYQFNYPVDNPMEKVVRIVKRHLDSLNKHEGLHDPATCKVCLVIYPIFVRHKEFCKGKMCNVQGCVVKGQYYINSRSMPSHPQLVPNHLTIQQVQRQQAHQQQQLEVQRQQVYQQQLEIQRHQVYQQQLEVQRQRVYQQQLQAQQQQIQQQELQAQQQQQQDHQQEMQAQQQQIQRQELQVQHEQVHHHHELQVEQQEVHHQDLQIQPQLELQVQLSNENVANLGQVAPSSESEQIIRIQQAAYQPNPSPVVADTSNEGGSSENPLDFVTMVEIKQEVDVDNGRLQEQAFNAAVEVAPPLPNSLLTMFKQESEDNRVVDNLD